MLLANTTIGIGESNDFENCLMWFNEISRTSRTTNIKINNFSGISVLLSVYLWARYHYTVINIHYYVRQKDITKHNYRGESVPVYDGTPDVLRGSSTELQPHTSIGTDTCDSVLIQDCLLNTVLVSVSWTWLRHSSFDCDDKSTAQLCNPQLGVMSWAQFLWLFITWI